MPSLAYQGFALFERVVDYEIVYCDYLGSPRVMTDQSGAVTWRQEYYAFGSDYGATSTGNTHKFTGHQQDAATGQYYAKARYFTTQLGRWSQPEPLLKGVPSGSFLSNPQKLNPYSYCLNNPLKYVDPNGLDVSVSQKMSAKVNTLYQRSSTFRDQYDAARRNSNAIVNVIPRGAFASENKNSDADTRLVNTGTKGEKVINIYMRNTPNIPLSALANEFQHVSEIANNPDIKTQGDYEKWLNENGIVPNKNDPNGRCTKEAMDAQNKVSTESAPNHTEDDKKEKEDVSSVSHIE